MKKLDYLHLYKQYPKKMGKKAGLTKLKTKVTTDEQYEDFLKALKNYVTYLEREQIEPEFIKYFGTFVNNYEDWLDDDAGSVVLRKRTMEDILGEE